MIEGGWSFVYASYALTLGSLGVLAVAAAMRLRAWARRAAELDKDKP